MTGAPDHPNPDDQQTQPAEGRAGRGDAVASAVVGSTLVTVGVLGRRLGKVARVGLTTAGGYVAAKAAAGSEPVRRTLGLATDEPGGGTRPVSAAVTVQSSPDEVYHRWRNLEELPRWFAHLASVTDLGSGRSRWVAAAPLGTDVAWEAELTEDRPGQVIAWRSLPGATIGNEGRVRFTTAPGDRGTEIHVELSYSPPAGPLGVAVAKLTGEEPGIQVRDALRRFKQIVEAGEAATIDGQPSGRGCDTERTPTDVERSTMGERTVPEKDREGKMASAVGPEIVRKDEVTQGTQVANLPHEEDTVGEASEDSFPASDPPAYTDRRDDEIDPTTGQR